MLRRPLLNDFRNCRHPSCLTSIASINDAYPDLGIHSLSFAKIGYGTFKSGARAANVSCSDLRAILWIDHRCDTPNDEDELLEFVENMLTRG
jgi:hypothetical protein